MGAMKRIATEQKMHPGTTFTRFNKNDRESIRTLLRGDEATRFAQMEMHRIRAERELPNGALASINLRLDFVGMRPTVTGRYMMFDTVTDRMRLAVVTMDAFVSSDKCSKVSTVTFLETGSTMSVDTVCKDTTLWFLIPAVEEDDKMLVRAIVQETCHVGSEVH